MKILTPLLGLLLFVALFFISLFAFSQNVAYADTRPTLTPTSPATYPKPETTVASITLIADGDGLETAVYETAVEWQDEHGEWHTVEEWQSPFNEYKQVTWAVAANDFGKGPFRWVVYQNEVAIKNSSDFYLPRSNNEVVTLHIDTP